MEKHAYRQAVEQAWELLGAIGKKGRVESVFLGRTCAVDFDKKSIVDLTGESAVQEHHEILILHYLAKEKAVTVTEPIEWVSFRDLPSGKFYYPAFCQRSIERLDRDFPSDPAALWENARRLKGQRLKLGDFSFRIQAFPKVFLALLYWRGDGEVSSRYDLLFNREVARIYSTEDAVVLARTVVGSLMKGLKT